MLIKSHPASNSVGANTNFTMDIGETFSIDLILDIDNIPIDLTAAVFKMQINLPTPAVLTNGSGITIFDPAGGGVRISAPSATTAAWPVGNYEYDLWMINDGIERPLLIGKFIVNKNISQVP